MKRRLALVAALGAGLLAAGVVTARALQDTPQDAQPVQEDPIGDLLREDSAPPQQPAPQPTPQAPPPVTASPGPQVIIIDPMVAPMVEVEEPEAEEEVAEAAPVEQTPLPPPGRRQRRPIAIVQAIDKITAESMRFEVEVGGRPVRFNRNLVFTARACEVSAPDEQTRDSVAYLEIAVQPRGAAAGEDMRQVFRGWMFASSPAISGIEHPLYDAWVIGCRA